MKFIHLKCLRQWLGRNENKKVTPAVITYSWKAFHCDLCKKKLNDAIYHKGKRLMLFDIEKPD
jgi:E3 ubiquitin-protein ligase DOA10